MANYYSKYSLTFVMFLCNRLNGKIYNSFDVFYYTIDFDISGVDYQSLLTCLNITLNSKCLYSCKLEL